MEKKVSKETVLKVVEIAVITVGLGLVVKNTNAIAEILKDQTKGLHSIDYQFKLLRDVVK